MIIRITSQSEEPYRSSSMEKEPEIISTHAGSVDSTQDAEYLEFKQLEQQFSEGSVEKKKLLRKVDLMLIPYLSLCYLWCSIDRSNAGNAKIFGFLEAINMTGHQYNIALMVFFFPYGVCQPFSNVAIKKFGPRLVLPTMITLWGVVAMCTTWVRSYHDYIAIRVFLGVFESVIYPGAYYVLSCYYTPQEITKRMATFYGANTLAGAFAGVLAYGIHNLDGNGGWASWKWIFFIEGIITVGIGLAGYLVLSSLPQDSNSMWGLSNPEFRFIKLRQKYIMGPMAVEQSYNVRDVFAVMKDPSTLLIGILFMAAGVATYSLSYTLPTMVKNLGYTAVRAQALSTPPYVAATIMTIGMSYWADKSGKRMLPIVVCYAVGIIGIIILWITVHHPNVPGVSYFAIFVAASGYNAQAPILGSWCAVNNPNPTRRAAAIGFYMMIGSVAGGPIGSNIYLTNEAPYYPLGFGFSIGISILGAIVPALINYFYLRNKNKKLDAAEGDLEGTQEQTHFRYTL